MPHTDAERSAQPDPDDYKGLTRWVLKSARSGAAAPALFVAGILDSSIVPMPLEVPLAGLMIGDRRKILLFFLAVASGALIGAALVYAAGALALEALLPRLGEGVSAQIEDAAERVRENAFAAVALGGLTPFPWPLVALGAGLAQVNPFVFLAGAAVGRGGRFALIGAGVALFGDKALAWWTGAPDWARIGFWVVVSVVGVAWLWLAISG